MSAAYLDLHSLPTRRSSDLSDELLTIIPLIKRRGAKLIALTGNPDSALAREADVHLDAGVDRKSTRLNSSHANISYAVFCLKKKTGSDDVAVTANGDARPVG